MALYSIEEAAGLVKLHPAHLRRLAREGKIPAQKVGALWILDESDVRQHDVAKRSAGRAISSGMSWAILELASHGLDSGGGDPSPNLAARLGDRRGRYRLRRHLAEAPAIQQWAFWLRRRAAPWRVWVHPGVLERLAADSRLHAGGGPATVLVGMGSGVGSPAEQFFYVTEADAAGVLNDYRGVQDFRGNLQLMVVPSDIAGRINLGPGAPVPGAVALVDLLESLDMRLRYLATEMLQGAVGRAKLDPILQ